MLNLVRGNLVKIWSNAISSKSGGVWGGGIGCEQHLTVVSVSQGHSHLLIGEMYLLPRNHSLDKQDIHKTKIQL